MTKSLVVESTHGLAATLSLHLDEPSDETLIAARGKDGHERLLVAVQSAAPHGHYFHDAVQHLPSLLFWLARHVRDEAAALKADPTRVLYDEKGEVYKAFSLERVFLSLIQESAALVVDKQGWHVL